MLCPETSIRSKERHTRQADHASTAPARTLPARAPAATATAPTPLPLPLSVPMPVPVPGRAGHSYGPGAFTGWSGGEILRYASAPTAGGRRGAASSGTGRLATQSL